MRFLAGSDAAQHDGRVSPSGPTPADKREAELRSLSRRRHIARHRSLVAHWLGQWMHRARRPEVAPLPTIAAGQVGISFAGHATALIRYAGVNIAFDPMLGLRLKGAKRAVRPGLSPADFGDASLVLISHGHADHLHRPTLAKLSRAATVILPPRTGHLVSDLGFARVVELGVGQSVQHCGVDIFTTPVRHGDRDCPALAYVIRGDGPSVYACGDSGYFSGFAEVGRRFCPDIALLPIGGYAPLSFRDRHMTPLDALYAFEDLMARAMIPIHYGAFSLSYETLEDPRRWLADIVRERGLDPFVVTLEPGQSRAFVRPRTRSTRSETDIPEPDWEEAQTARRPPTEPVPAPEPDDDAEAVPQAAADAAPSIPIEAESPVSGPIETADGRGRAPTSPPMA